MKVKTRDCVAGVCAAALWRKSQNETSAMLARSLMEQGEWLPAN